MCAVTAISTPNLTHTHIHTLTDLPNTKTPSCVFVFTFIAKGSHLQLLQKSRLVNLHFTIVFQIQLSNTQSQRNPQTDYLPLLLPLLLQASSVLQIQFVVSSKGLFFKIILTSDWFGIELERYDL